MLYIILPACLTTFLSVYFVLHTTFYYNKHTYIATSLHSIYLYIVKCLFTTRLKIISTVLCVYNLLLLAHRMDREGPQDQSSTDTISGTCTLIEI